MGKRYAFSSGLQEFDFRRHFPEHRIQTHLGQRSVRDATLCQEGRTSCQGKTLNDPNKLVVVDDEQGPLIVGHTDARGTGVLPRFPRSLRLFRHPISMTSRRRWVNVTEVFRQDGARADGRRDNYTRNPVSQLPWGTQPLRALRYVPICDNCFRHGVCRLRRRSLLQEYFGRVWTN